MIDDFAKLAAARRSCRAFLDRPVSQDQIAAILTTARTAPSGANLQPGMFHVLTGSPLTQFSDAVLSAIDAGAEQTKEYSYFPTPMPATLKARQRAAGYALYSALGIERRDVAARRDQFRRNYRFFDAPVGIVVTIQRDMGAGCFMDLGMALQTLFLAAEDAGLGACGIGALANYGPQVHAALDLDEDQLVVCGIALGWPDTAHPANQVRTERAAIDDYARFIGFDDPSA